MSFNVQPTKYTSQHTDNLEFDEDAKAKRAIVVDVLPTSGNNPSTSITESTVGTVTTTTIQKTIGSVTYQQTITEDSSDNSTNITAWSVV